MWDKVGQHYLSRESQMCYNGFEETSKVIQMLWAKVEKRMLKHLPCLLSCYRGLFQNCPLINISRCFP